PHCGQKTRLTLEAPPATTDHPSAADLVNAFGGPVRRTPVSFFYQLGLVLVTVVMMILPVIYLAMVAAAGYGVYLFATHYTTLLTYHGGGRLYFFQLLLYITPLFVGVVLVFFMVKPLFARRAP